MPPPTAKNALKNLRISDLRGMAQLATQATAGVTRIAEEVHQSVWATLGFPGDGQGRTRGITGLVYRTVQEATRLAGKGVDTVLARVEPLLEPAVEGEPGTPQREAWLAALNGVMGDRLAASDNPFAIPMTLRFQGETLNWQALPPSFTATATGKVLVLIHGLCLNDLQRHAQHKGHDSDLGEALAAQLGYTPVYLRYNSGLRTSQNGRELSAQLEQLVHHWPTEIEELAVMAHSMGGLLIRSAVHTARQEALDWPDRLKSIVFLGTPHHGAPLERAGHWLDLILGSTPYTAPFARLGQLRSAGITDLRHGTVLEEDGLDEDWLEEDRQDEDSQNRDRPGRGLRLGRAVPLPEGVACYTVAATKAAQRSALADRLIGDGLVPLRSALGQHDDPERDLRFAEESLWIAYQTSHMGLLTSPEVRQLLLRWLGPDAALPKKAPCSERER